MRQSGAPGGSRQSPVVLALGWAFGVAMTVLFALVMAFGVRKGSSDVRGLGRPLTVVTLINLAAWTLLVLSYRHYLGRGGRTLFLAMPVPSAVMLYLFFPLQALFNLLFVAGYERWVLTPGDWRQYSRIAPPETPAEQPPEK